MARYGEVDFFVFDAGSIRRLRLSNYLGSGEHFHLAWKTISPGSVPGSHTHDFYELFRVVSGAGRHHVNGLVEDLAPGALVFIRPDDTHAFEARPGQPLSIVNLLFTPDTADHLSQRYPDDLAGRWFWSREIAPDRLTLDSPRAADLARRERRLDAGTRSLGRIEGFLTDFLIGEATRPDFVIPDAPAWLRRACERAREPEVLSRGAAGFVDAAGRAHAHVCRVAKAHLGLTPSAYMNRVRMDYAARRLSGSDESIAGIALDCGIGNLSHFYRLFRAEHGMAPAAYRRRHRRDIV